jgi:uncharacterized protein (TIGR02757 family)
LIEKGIQIKLDQLVEIYNNKRFIEQDPISIPHKFTKKLDIEVIGFLIATLSWGNRKSIINSGEKLISIMENSPYKFVMNYKEEDFSKLDFKHRTFNSFDLHFFFLRLKYLLGKYKSLENVFFKGFQNETNSLYAIDNFRSEFLGDYQNEIRTKKHVANPKNGSAAKRINMFLRWMVRNDNNGVDFGLWEKISPSKLSCPLDVHSGNSARKMGLIKRTQNDWKTVDELDKVLRTLDPIDPAKYDFALFGWGIDQKK